MDISDKAWRNLDIITSLSIKCDQMTLKTTFFRLFIGLLLGASSLSHAEGSEPRSYAVMSLIGDGFSTVIFRENIGSNRDQNKQNFYPVSESGFDVSTVLAADAAIKKSQPDVRTVLLLAKDSILYKTQNEMFDSAESLPESHQLLKSMLKGQPVSHLILVTKFRSEAEFKFADNNYTGKGKLEGLGFYVHNNLQIMDINTKNSGTGILAPYVYIKIRLLDANTLEVIKETTQKQSRIVGNTKPNESSVYVWDSMKPKQKIELLQSLITASMNEGIPNLFK